MDTSAYFFLVVQILPIASISRIKHDIVLVHPTTLNEVIYISIQHIYLCSIHLLFQVNFSYLFLFQIIMLLSMLT
jgi:hypothetical protein